MKGKPCNESLELARRIRAAGVRIHIEEDDCGTLNASSGGLRVYLQGGVAESSVFDFNGGTGVMLSLVITCNLPRFAISAFDLELPWRGRIQWLEDPREINGSSRGYRFGGSSLLEFDRSLVLNHVADVRHVLQRGTSFEGYLLGIGTNPISDQFVHGAMIPAFITVVDQFGHRYKSPISIWADRSEKFACAHRPKPKRAPLFECPDRQNSYADDLETTEKS